MYATEHVSYYEQLPKTLKQKPNERRRSGKGIEERREKVRKVEEKIAEPRTEYRGIENVPGVRDRSDVN